MQEDSVTAEANPAEEEVKQPDAPEVKAEADVAEQAQEQAQEQAGETEVVVEIEGVEAEKDDPNESSVIRALRKADRQKDRVIREKERQLRELQQQISAPAQAKAKPTLEACGWDEERFEAELVAWSDSQRKLKEEQERAQREQEEQTNAFKSRLSSFEEGLSKLAPADAEDARHSVAAKLTQAQQALLVDGMDDPAKLVLALYRYPSELEKLAAEKNPARFVAKAKELEMKTKTESRAKPPAPERRLSGGSGVLASSTRLEQLKEEARKTGEYTKYMEAKRAKAA